MTPFDPFYPLSRRNFLSQAAAGVVPLLLTSACGKRQVTAPGNGPEGSKGSATHTLQVGRFTGAPDGRRKEIWGYDEMLPGPVIRVKEGDTLRVKVQNGLGLPTTVHWHGMHQPGTWRMDGVDEVSGPPIPAGQDFIYEFRATPAGTHWYHSHVGVQYGNGLFGPLIVEEPKPIAVYDREEILFFNDWFLEMGDDILAQIIKGGMKKMDMKKMDMKDRDMKDMDMKGMKDKPDLGDFPFQSALINGKGRAPGDTKSPLTVLNVKKGETIRLRLINGSSTYALRFQIDGHPLTVIASDGAPVVPVTVDNLAVTLGERYDVLLKADGEGMHWIRVSTLDGKEALAILRYQGSNEPEPAPTPARWGPKSLLLEDLRSPTGPDLADVKPKEIPLTLGGSMSPYRWNINDQYFPKADPLVFAKDEHIRFVMNNPTMMDHPFHLHGHYFRVLGKPDALNLKDPPFKDTVVIPAKGSLALQWQTTNPGRWFYHCHIEWHLATGMARVMEIKPYT